MLKLSDTYDLLDPQTGEVVGQVREKVSGWIHTLRFLADSKRMLPTTVEVRSEGTNDLVLKLERGFSFFRPTVRVSDGTGQPVAVLQSKFLSLGGGFFIHTPDGQKFGEVKGDWKGWDFKILDARGGQLGTVTKKWAGFGKEFFTTADNYVIEMTDPTMSSAMGLAAALAIDTVLKEK